MKKLTIEILVLFSASCSRLRRNVCRALLQTKRTHNKVNAKIRHGWCLTCHFAHQRVIWLSPTLHCFIGHDALCFPCNGNKRNIVTELPDGTPLAHSLLFSVSFWYARAFTLFPESHGGSHILVSILGDKAWANRAKEMYYSLFISFVVLPRPHTQV